MGLEFLMLSICFFTDYYLFNQLQKNIKLKNILINAVIYQVLLLILCAAAAKINPLNLLIVFIIGSSHFILRLLALIFRLKYPVTVFLGEQTLNVIIILFCASFLNDVISFNQDIILISKYVLSILIIGIPGNVIFKILFQHFKPQDDDESESSTFKNAGATIGILERILIFICLANNLFTSIGLIFTAKSIARYKKINDEPAFSEYYLIGTLASVLFTVIVFITIF